MFSVNAQDTLYLSHNKMLQMTLSQNLQIQSNELKFKLAKASFYKSIGKALPTLGMGIKRYELSGYTQSTEGTFADVDKNTGLLTAETLDAALRKSRVKIKVICVVHLGGRVCDMEEISKIALKYGCFLVEDCCHASGAHYFKNGRGAA